MAEKKNEVKVDSESKILTNEQLKQVTGGVNSDLGTESARQEKLRIIINKTTQVIDTPDVQKKPTM